MDNKSKYFKIFSECIPVKGFKRAAIYDLPRSEFKFIPMGLYKILLNHEDRSIEEIKLSFENDKIVDQYFDFLISNEYIFFCDKDELELFPKLDLSWDYPALITNAIIDTSSLSQLPHYIKIFSLVEDLGCRDIALHATDNITSFEHLSNLMKVLNDSKIKSIDVYAKYNSDLREKMNQFCLANPRVRNFILYCSPVENIDISPIGMGNAVLYPRGIDNQKFRLEKRNFSVEISLFTESQQRHTYFNRKLYIGSKGEIKNAPECVEEFGYIQDLKDCEELKDIISQPKFQKYWFVSPDMIDVTKDSEFRHMCVDNRIPYQRKDGSWYHKEEPEYNPYICKWEGEEGYLTLEECGVISNEEGFQINHDRVAEINKELWGD